MAYEKRFRERVLSYLAKGHTYRETSSIFAVDISTIQNWKRLLSETGSLTIKKRKRPPKKLPSIELITYIEQHPDVYLSEIGEYFNCSGEAVRQALKRLDITRKKRA